MALTQKQRRFVDEYLIDLNATQAAIRAGYSEKTARQIAQQNLSKLDIAEAIQARREAVSKRAEIDAAFVLQKWAEQVNADPSDLIQYRRGCCRYCWGESHLYQWTDGELIKARDDAEVNGKRLPDESGGTGYDKKREPNPDCPACGGEGIGRVYAADTRTIPESAKAIFAGVRQGKDGLEIKMHDQQAALANIAKHLGMFPSKVEVTGKDGSPLIPVKAVEMTDEQLAAIAAGRS